jgi:hypothetical protein
MSTLPQESTAAQKSVLGQETSVSSQEYTPISSGPQTNVGGSMRVTFQAAAPPVGLVEVATLSPWVTATHMLVLGQDTLHRLSMPLR